MNEHFYTKETKIEFDNLTVKDTFKIPFIILYRNKDRITNHEVKNKAIDFIENNSGYNGDSLKFYSEFHDKEKSFLAMEEINKTGIAHGEFLKYYNYYSNEIQNNIKERAESYLSIEDDLSFVLKKGLEYSELNDYKVGDVPKEFSQIIHSDFTIKLLEEMLDKSFNESKNKIIAIERITTSLGHLKKKLKKDISNPLKGKKIKTNKYLKSCIEELLFIWKNKPDELDESIKSNPKITRTNSYSIKEDVELSKKIIKPLSGLWRRKEIMSSGEFIRLEEYISYLIKNGENQINLKPFGVTSASNEFIKHTLYLVYKEINKQYRKDFIKLVSLFKQFNNTETTTIAQKLSAYNGDYEQDLKNLIKYK